MDTVQMIEKKYRELAGKIPEGKRREMIHFQTDKQQKRFYYTVTQQEDSFHFQVWEKKKCRMEKKTQDMEQLLYWCIERFTWEEARALAYRRIRPYDRRRDLHKKQLELMAYAGEEYVEKLRESIRLELQYHPYHDETAYRIFQIKKYRRICLTLIHLDKRRHYLKYGEKIKLWQVLIRYRMLRHHFVCHHLDSYKYIKEKTEKVCTRVQNRRPKNDMLYTAAAYIEKVR